MSRKLLPSTSIGLSRLLAASVVLTLAAVSLGAAPARAALLGRAPDSGGLAYWASQIGTEGDLVLAANLAASPEYFDRAQTRFY